MKRRVFVLLYNSQLPPMVDFRQNDAKLLFPIYIPAEFDIIGEDEVAQTLPVTLQLFAVFNGIQKFADIFGFYVTRRYSVSIYDEIGGAAINVFRFIYR